jgi:hypothetical protein
MTIVTIKTMTATCCWAGVVFFFLELQGASPALFKKQKKKKKKKKKKKQGYIAHCQDSSPRNL